MQCVGRVYSLHWLISELDTVWPCGTQIHSATGILSASIESKTGIVISSLSNISAKMMSPVRMTMKLTPLFLIRIISIKKILLIKGGKTNEYW